MNAHRSLNDREIVGTKRVTRLALQAGNPIEEPIASKTDRHRKILKAKRTQLSSSVLGISKQEIEINRSSSIKIQNSNTSIPTQKWTPKKSAKKNNKLNLPSPFLINLGTSAEDQFTDENNLNKRKLRSAKVDVSQDDDNLSTETSSADELKWLGRKAGKQRGTKKLTHKKLKNTKKKNSEEQISEETSSPTVNDGKASDPLKIKGIASDVKDSKMKKSNSKDVKLRTRRQKIKENAKKEEYCEEFNKENVDKSAKKSASKIELQRSSTYLLEEPSLFLLNSLLGSTVMDSKMKFNVSGVAKICDENDKIIPAAVVGEADSTTFDNTVSPKVFQNKRNSTTKKHKLQEPPVEFYISPTKRNKSKIPQEKSPLDETELRRSTYEIKKNDSSPVSLQSTHLTTIKPFTPSSSLKTPKSVMKNKGSLLKQTFYNKSYNVTSSQRKIDKIHTSTTTKLPNFALIHKQAEEKMENLQEFKNRQVERAKNLLSGLKPSASKGVLRKSASADDVFTQTKSKKQLTYAAKSSTVESPVVKKNVTPVVEKRNVNSAATCKTLKQSTKSKIPLKSDVPNNVCALKRTSPSSGYNRFGFKLGKRADIRKELKIAVANKVKDPKLFQTKEKRELVKGVRSNRRFDLLMQMRQKE